MAATMTKGGKKATGKAGPRKGATGTARGLDQAALGRDRLRAAPRGRFESALKKAKTMMAAIRTLIPDVEITPTNRGGLWHAAKSRAAELGLDVSRFSRKRTAATAAA